MNHNSNSIDGERLERRNIYTIARYKDVALLPSPPNPGQNQVDSPSGGQLHVSAVSQVGESLF